MTYLSVVEQVFIPVCLSPQNGVICKRMVMPALPMVPWYALRVCAIARDGVMESALVPMAQMVRIGHWAVNLVEDLDSAGRLGWELV